MVASNLAAGSLWLGNTTEFDQDRVLVQGMPMCGYGTFSPARIRGICTATLTVPEVAQLLGFGRTAIYDLVAAGRIPHFRIGASIRFDPFVLAEWLRSRFVLAAA